MYNREGRPPEISDKKKPISEKDLIAIVRVGVISVCVVLLLMAMGLVIFLNPELLETDEQPVVPDNKPLARWSPPDSTSIQSLPNADLVLYGKDLIAHTSTYLGPNGSVAQISNGMNCQNCHLKRGTQFFGN